MQDKLEIEELIVKSFSQSLNPEEKIYLDSWLDESKENKIHFVQLRNIWQVAHPAFNPDEIDAGKAEARVRRKILLQNCTHNSVAIWWQRAAAVLFLPLIILMGYLFFNRSQLKKVIAYQEVTSPFGISSKIELSDGSTVWLNSGSKLKFPVTFESKERKVYLSGEAYFKVHSDKSHPFIVKTCNMQIRATGTQFNVEAYPSGAYTAVTLMEGKVDVNLNKNQKEQLHPDQRIVLNSKTKKYSLVKTDAKNWGMWKEGVLVFRDESLEEVFQRIGRNFNIDIELKDSVLGKQIYRATFEGESLEEILRLLKMTAPIKYKRFGRNKLSDNKFTKERIEVFRAQ